MTIERLNDAVAAAKAEVKTALETVLAELNKGQRKNWREILPCGCSWSGTAWRSRSEQHD